MQSFYARRRLKIELAAVAVAMAMLAAGQALAQQQITVLHTFTGAPADGGFPTGSLVASGNTLYGTTGNGGADNDGTVFQIGADGSGFQLVHSFQGADGTGPTSLVLSGSTFYGATTTSGPGNFGTIYSMNMDGSGLNTLHSFDVGTVPQLGQGPPNGLIKSGATLFGKTTDAAGVLGGYGLFSLGIDSTGFNILPSAYPVSIALNGSIIYGFDGRSITRVNSDGSGYQSLATLAIAQPPQTLNDVVGPLILSGTTLYGIDYFLGDTFVLTSGTHFPVEYDATVFKVNTDGSGYQILKAFSVINPASDSTNQIGTPALTPALVLSGSTLYGTIPDNLDGSGLLFGVNTDGSGYQPLGQLPVGSGYLLADGTTLYGTVSRSGAATPGGELFSLSIPEPSCAGLLLAGGALLTHRRAPRG